MTRSYFCIDELRLHCLFEAHHTLVCGRPFRASDGLFDLGMAARTQRTIQGVNTRVNKPFASIILSIPFVPNRLCDPGNYGLSHLLVGGRVRDKYCDRKVLAVRQRDDADVIGRRRDPILSSGCTGFVGDDGSLWKHRF